MSSSSVHKTMVRDYPLLILPSLLEVEVEVGEYPQHLLPSLVEGKVGAVEYPQQNSSLVLEAEGMYPLLTLSLELAEEVEVGEYPLQT